MRKKFETLRELSKCDTGTGSEQTLLEKWHQWTCLTQEGHQPSICKKKKKNAMSVKRNKAKHNIKRGLPVSFRGDLAFFE